MGRELREGSWASRSREDPGAAPSLSSAQSRSSSPCFWRRERDDLFLGSGSRLYPLLGVSWQTHRDTRQTDEQRHEQKRHVIPIVIDVGTGTATPSSSPPQPGTPKDRQRDPAQRTQTETRRDEDRQTHAHGHLPAHLGFRGPPRRRGGTGAAHSSSGLAVPGLPRPRAHPLRPALDDPSLPRTPAPGAACRPSRAGSAGVG